MRKRDATIGGIYNQVFALTFFYVYLFFFYFLLRQNTFQHNQRACKLIYAQMSLLSLVQ